MSPNGRLRALGSAFVDLIFTRRAGGELFADRRFHFCLLAAISFAVLFAKLHVGDLAGYDDAVYAHEGKRMATTGEWWSVYLNGRLDADKPPLFVWLEALSMLVFGVSDFAARVPAALLGWGTILLVFFIARELTADYWLPVWAMLVLLGSHFFMKYAMRAMTDVPFTFCFALAVFFYLRSLKHPRRLIWCGLAVSLGIMMRSILGLIPLALIVLHALLIGRWRWLWTKQAAAGLLCALALPLLWFGSQVQLHGPAFLALHFSWTMDNLPFSRGGGLGGFVGGIAQHPWQLLAVYWPWLPLLLIGVCGQVKKTVGERDAASALLTVWVLCVLLPFSLIETRWLRYIMPVFPAFAILTAIPLSRLISTPRRRSALQLAYGVLCLTMVGLAVNPKYRERPEEMRRLAPLAAAATPPAGHILLYTERRPRDAHLYQVIWYADRHCELLAEIEQVQARIDRDPRVAVIMDKEIFARFAADRELAVEIHGETESFVCWSKAERVERAEAQFE